MADLSMWAGIDGISFAYASKTPNDDTVIDGTPTVYGNTVNYDLAAAATLGTDVGTIELTASSTNYTDFTVTVSISVSNKTPQTLSFNENNVVKVFGTDTTYTNTLNGAQTTVTYTSGNEDVATVANDGTVTIVGAGTSIITATAAAEIIGSTEYLADDASYILTVNNGEVSTTEDETTVFEGNFVDLDGVILNGVSLTVASNGDLSGYTGYTANGGVLGKVFDSSIGVTLYKEFLAFLPAGGYTLNVTTTTSGGTSSTTEMEIPAKTNHSLIINNPGSGSSGTSTRAVGEIITISAGSRSGYTFNGWTATGVTLDSNSSNSTQFVMMANDATITANWSRNSTGSSGSSSSDSNDEYRFWQDVKEAIEEANKGETVKADANDFDKMSWTVMEALRTNGIALIIEWNGGEDIVIPAGKALVKETGRIYWPLSLLAEEYKGNTAPATSTMPENPETGGDVIPTAPVATVIAPVTPAPSTDTPEMEITPPTGGFEPEAFAGTEDNAVAVAEQSNHMVTIILVMVLVVATGGFIFYKKRSAEPKK